MKVAIYAPTTGTRLGRTSLQKDIIPGYLRTHGWRVGSYLGEPVIRSDNPRGYADQTRATWKSLRYWLELTGWNARVEVNQAEARALISHALVPSTVGTYRLTQSPNNGGRYQLLAGHGNMKS